MKRYTPARGREMRKPNKYKNVKTVVDGIKFDSKKEAARYLYLKDQLASGNITDLQLQPKFDIAASVYLDGTKRRVRYYIADFAYTDKNGQRVVEDVKGMKTAMYKLKRHLVKERHEIEVIEV